MRLLLLGASLFISIIAVAQPVQKTQNVFVITIDGLRWQELFTGANETLINNPHLAASTENTKAGYWSDDAITRRKLLMPFLWNVVAKKGQVYGNRNAGSRMDVANKYHFSYPGYSEIFTGYADAKFVPNTPVQNRNTNVFEYLNRQVGYVGKVIAFSSWNVFPFILNEERCGFEVNSGYEPMQDAAGNTAFEAINQAQNCVADKSHTRHDELTYVAAKEYVKQRHPKVMVLGFGETDEFAHQEKYDQYLDATAKADSMIADLWQYVQGDPYYRGNTTFIITTDHGRGRRAGTWSKHLFFIPGSKEVWIAIMGPEIKPMGEMKNVPVLHHNQIAATIATLLGQTFTCEHPVGAPLSLPVNSQPEADHVLVKRVE